MEYSIVICEDEKGFSEGLRDDVLKVFIAKGAKCNIVICRSGKSFEETVYGSEKEKNPISPNLIFMDIGLGDSDGVALIEKYRKTIGKKIPVIFVSSMEERVLDGYEVNALAFLYKRNYRDKLERTLSRFFKEYSDSMGLSVKNEGKLELIALHDIYYVESNGRKSLIHKETEEVSDERAIGILIRELPQDMFFEVYKCIFVNIEHVKRIDAENVVLDNGCSVMLSRRKRKDAMNAVMDYIGRN